MKSLSLAQWGVVLILALLTALEPLSIDLYLPGFLTISKALKTDIVSVQISLSTFLAGFAIGQLIWGPLADKFGRKKPILVSLLIFILASIACIYVTKIEHLWVLRFVQAIGGCGGIVISRAVVTDYFDKNQTLKVFSLLAMIMGVAPIAAPLLGNQVLHWSHHWESLFTTMMIIGVFLFLLTFFFLPETKQKKESAGVDVSKGSVLKDYYFILKNRRFLVYALVAGIVNGALMIYVSNGPFLIMDKGGFSSDMFSVIFAINS
ncbi:MAG: multidrug effflux MFS transporter, partial [Bacteroidales bacterium]|nr:multidrug effflux MFS transporter [Bacteroidales bacterium]